MAKAKKRARIYNVHVWFRTGKQPKGQWWRGRYVSKAAARKAAREAVKEVGATRACVQLRTPSGPMPIECITETGGKFRAPIARGSGRGRALFGVKGKR